MSLSKARKIMPVLPPDQWRKLKHRLSDKQLFWNCRGCKYICYFFFMKRIIFLNIFKNIILKYLDVFTFLSFFAVTIHLKFQDVDPTFIYGMLSEVSDEYSG